MREGQSTCEGLLTGPRDMCPVSLVWVLQACPARRPGGRSLVWVPQACPAQRPGERGLEMASSMARPWSEALAGAPGATALPPQVGEGLVPQGSQGKARLRDSSAALDPQGPPACNTRGEAVLSPGPAPACRPHPE